MNLSSKPGSDEPVPRFSTLAHAERSRCTGLRQITKGTNLRSTDPSVIRCRPCPGTTSSIPPKPGAEPGTDGTVHAAQARRLGTVSSDPGLEDKFIPTGCSSVPAFFRSLLEVADRSETTGLVKNSDGSVDVYFGPGAPVGKEANWIQTIPGKGWFSYFRFYGPTEAFFDKSRSLADFEKQEDARSSRHNLSSGDRPQGSVISTYKQFVHDIRGFARVASYPRICALGGFPGSHGPFP